MNSDKPTGFLERYGADLIDAGYDIIPIKRGEKRPPFTGWEKIRATKRDLRGWLDDGYGRCGVGLIAANTPGVDIDVRDDELSRHMEEWVHENIAMAPVRVGHAPKRLLMFRADEPFPKINSQTYIDENGEKHKVEILGDGQQFVAFHIHPETGKEFKWLYKDGPLVTEHDDLPLLTHAQAQSIVDEFEAQAEARGWQVKRRTPKTANLHAVVSSRRGRDVFLEDTNKTDISDDELHAKLLLVPAQADYDGWLQIGMALYHQYDGGDRGLELWHEWSELAYPDEYDADEIDDKWKRGKLSINNKGRAPVTARLIIKLAKENEERIATETLAELTKEINAAQSLPQLREAADKVKKVELDTASREGLAGLVQTKFKNITHQSLSIRIARDMVRYESHDVRDLPRWLEDWCYLKSEDKFYNSRTSEAVSPSAFNTAYSRFMLTKQDVLEGRSVPDRLPAHVATNIYQIPVLSAKRYMPGLDSVFTMDGVQYANTYSDRNVPEVPEELTKRDKRNIEIVKAHIKHLFPDEREGRILLDYLAYIVQNPGHRRRWAVLLQGVEGDGKSFFANLMANVLGGDNVRVVTPKTVQTDFNGWAEGSQVVFIDEIRLHGHNRYDVLNQVKPLITNDVIEIHRKGIDPYNVPNTAAYLLATNFRDALPLDDNDSRYFVLFSRFQTKEALAAFTEKNPEYYNELHATYADSAGALRGWLLNHEIGEEVRDSSRAPASRAKAYMAMMAKPEEQTAIEEVLDSSMRLDISRTLLSATDLTELLYNEGAETPQTSKLNKLLSNMGFTLLGKFRVNGRLRRYWSMKPERFMKNGEVDSALIREYAESDL